MLMANDFFVLMIVDSEMLDFGDDCQDFLYHDLFFIVFALYVDEEGVN